MSWAQLQAILQEMRDEAQRQRQEPPTACPNDGQPLEYHPGKTLLHCKFCGFTTVGQPQ